MKRHKNSTDLFHVFVMVLWYYRLEYENMEALIWGNEGRTRGSQRKTLKENRNWGKLSLNSLKFLKQSSGIPHFLPDCLQVA